MAAIDSISTLPLSTLAASTTEVNSFVAVEVIAINKPFRAGKSGISKRTDWKPSPHFYIHTQISKGVQFSASSEVNHIQSFKNYKTKVITNKVNKIVNPLSLKDYIVNTRTQSKKNEELSSLEAYVQRSNVKKPNFKNTEKIIFDDVKESYKNWKVK